MIKVYYAYSELTGEESLKHQVEPLPEIVHLRLNCLKRKEDRILVLAALFLLKEALSQNGHSEFLLRELQYSRSGRPFFKGAAFDFSISHTEQCAALAFADNCRVGIDIEKIKPLDLTDFEYVFSPEVWNLIYTSKSVFSSFYTYWTRLESAVKADGRGLPLLNGNLKINNNPIEIEGVHWYVQHQCFNTSISCCIASDRKQNVAEPIEVRLP